jgi:gliding motility-associated-like protein
VGGLSGSFYNFSEQSTLQSPCFDFSTLAYPWISFKIFWEDEWRYDGMVLQSSINGGATWQNVGAYNDPVDCMNDNWYTYNNVTWLNSIPVRNGWTGRIGPTSGNCQGGNGSGGWVTAKHCMSSLAGQPNVIFRFLFGSGTTCNGYDGIAIDDIFIDNAQPNVANFSYTCVGGNTVNFSDLSTPCPNTFNWDFGDPNSGPANLSSLQNPSHTFSAPGTYNVTLNTSGPCNAPGATVIPITILGATITATNVSCNGNNDGTAFVNVLGSNGPVTYLWSPGGQTTQGINGLSPGNYTVTINSANGCPVTASITITQPTVLTSTFSQTNVSCNGGSNGSASVSLSGGTPAYTYAWTPSGGNSAIATGLSAGTYTCNVSDANGCILTQTFAITEPSPLSIAVSSTATTCGNSNGSVTAVVTGGVGIYTYAWSPGAYVTSTVNNIGAGNYSVAVTDQNGCTTSAVVTVAPSNGVVASILSQTNVLCFGQSTGAIYITQTGGNPGYTYNWLPNFSTSDSLAGIPAGNYQVNVTDANGCSSSVSITITQPPQLTITATANPSGVCSGTAVQLSATGAGGTPAYNFSWNPGNLNGSSVNFVPFASGTYTANVTDANGCSVTAQTSVVVYPVPVAAFVSDTTFGCGPLCVNFSDASTVSSPSVISSWNWNFGDGNFSTLQNPSHCYSTAGNYSVQLMATTIDGCANTITLTNYINVFASPEAAFTTNQQNSSDLTTEVFFIDNSTNAISWDWNFGDALNSSSTLQNPSFTYVDPICYPVRLIVANNLGCTDTAMNDVCVVPDVEIFVPNTFTPNGDGTNDVFIPKGDGLTDGNYELMIFDRWGNLIFESHALNDGWDGKVKGSSSIAPIDTYVWRLKVKDIKGINHQLIGHVNLIK